MGTITLEQIVSADGYASDRDGGLDFAEAVEAGGDDQEQLGWLSGIDAILLGRRTYEMFADFWPGADPAQEVVAGPINALPKFVMSNTLASAPWGSDQIEVLGGDGVEAARRLKARFSSIVVWGSLSLADALIGAGEVDILRLRVVPVLIGEGRSFTPNSLGLRVLKTESVHQHPSGHLTVQYRLT